MNKYKAFYKGKNIEVDAKTSYDAQIVASNIFKAKKRYEVTVMLLQRADGTEVVHVADF